MQHATAAKGPDDAPDVKVDKATGPVPTVAEVHAQNGAKGKSVTIRGKVVKFTSKS